MLLSLSGVEANNVTPYRHNIVREVYANWHPPKSNKPISVVIGITIFRNSKKRTCKILVSSGNKLIDNGAIEAGKKAAIPWPGEWCRHKSISFRVRFNSDQIDKFSYPVLDVQEGSAQWQR